MLACSRSGIPGFVKHCRGEDGDNHTLRSDTMSLVIQAVNFVKLSALDSKFFNTPCLEISAASKTLLLHEVTHTPHTHALHEEVSHTRTHAHTRTS